LELQVFFAAMPQITRIFDLLVYKSRYHKDDMVAGKKEGKWILYSTENFIVMTDALSKGLIASGIVKGDKIAIISSNRPEWNICDFGIMQTGAVSVPIYPTLSENDLRFILSDAGIKVAFVADKSLFHKLEKLKAESFGELKIYTFEKGRGLRHWHELIDTGKKNLEINLDDYRKMINPGDLLTLIYTSGTTGTPKGVMLTHNNLISNVKASSLLYPGSFSKALSFLPLSHIFERMVIYTYFYLGISVYYAESMDTIAADIRDVKPNGFTTVPRLLEKVYDRIVTKGSELKGIKHTLFFWALNLGLKYELNGKNGLAYPLQLAVANKLIFKKWREALGGNIIVMVSGGAALQPRLARVFWAAGMPVLEGYGLTETSPVITVNALGKGQTEFATVGKPIKDVEIKIAQDGEILCRGPNVMKGYYNRPDLTAEVIDANGFFHTGDIGELTANGFLRITDRKKEVFKTAGGKYVAPQTLENKYKESQYIEQIMVLGENRRFPAALIVPAFDALKEWCKRKSIPWTSREEIIKNPQVIEKYQREIDRFNKNFGHWEQVKKFVLLPKEWSIEGGELTPKLSFRRKVILEKYIELIESIYK
jgi:long-chain acyl-CoA synthetase